MKYNIEDTNNPDHQGYYNSLFEQFTAAALTGLLAGPRGGIGGSVDFAEVAHTQAKAMMKELGYEKDE